MRYGAPMYAPAQFCRVFVTVEEPGKPARIVTWNGDSFKAIRRAAARCYGEGADLQFGAPMWITGHWR